MRILVIGGTNFIGPFVIDRLHQQGYELTVFHRGKTQAKLPEGVREILGDRRPIGNKASELQQVAPDVVLDMVPMLEQDAQEVMEIFRGIARRIVALSSQDVYKAFGRVNLKESGPVDLRIITEDSPLRENLYPHRGEQPKKENDPLKWTDDYDKILVERVIMSDPALPGTILRLPMVYGPYDYQHRTFAFLKRMDDGRPTILLDELEAQWKWSHGYVENVADAIALAVTDERAAGRIYNVAEPITFTMEEWVREIGKVAGWQGQIVRVPHGKLPEPLRWGINAEQHIVVDSSRIRQELGYRERIDIDEAHRRTIEWERGHPPKKIDPQEFNHALENELLRQYA